MSKLLGLQIRGREQISNRDQRLMSDGRVARQRPTDASTSCLLKELRSSKRTIELQYCLHECTSLRTCLAQWRPAEGHG